jgi:uncharacterized beta-barrel protein YwiB (DUF1934 family)
MKWVTLRSDSKRGLRRTSTISEGWTMSWRRKVSLTVKRKIILIVLRGCSWNSRYIFDKGKRAISSSIEVHGEIELNAETNEINE